MQNFQRTILRQYQNSPTIMALLTALNDALDPSANIATFEEMILDVLTASGYGLDVWGKIVGVGRVLTIGAVSYFGFKESTTGIGFDQAQFYSGGAVTQNYSLSDDAYRQLILAKASANLWDGSIKQLNAILMGLFGTSGNTWCTDGGNMTMTYTFNFFLDPVQLSIVQTSGVLPRPAGVAVSVVQL